MRTVWMGSLSSWQVNNVKRQFGSRANGELHRLCVHKVADTFVIHSSGWKRWVSRNIIIHTPHRWILVNRWYGNDGKLHCGIRVPRSIAHKFYR